MIRVASIGVILSCVNWLEFSYRCFRRALGDIKKAIRICKRRATGSTICNTPWPGLTCSRNRSKPNCLSLFTSRVTEPRFRPNSSASLNAEPIAYPSLKKLIR